MEDLGKSESLGRYEGMLVWELLFFFFGGGVIGLGLKNALDKPGFFFVVLSL